MAVVEAAVSTEAAGAVASMAVAAVVVASMAVVAAVGTAKYNQIKGGRAAKHGRPLISAPTLPPTATGIHVITSLPATISHHAYRVFWRQL